MGRVKKTKKFALVKRMLNPKDQRLNDNSKPSTDNKGKGKAIGSSGGAAGSSSSKSLNGVPVRHINTPAASLFFNHNTALGPPYRVLVDTNFINFSLQNKIELVQGMMDCLFAKTIPCITDCVLAELESLGSKYRVALRVARDPRFERLACSHKGNYADDCIINRIQTHKCYIVATCDRELRRRVRQVPGIPLMYIAQHQYRIERLPDGGLPS
ncbi:rRNA-processing protein fcf1 [Tilletia horrida]|uniref:rRNA-processing protein fcf1 n=1 Tax=Tilletia horrida TaxID=155126 RepID=A0AAN6GQN1_9BASI|nr:rRNA-processing protein fcf1 [Tilletia horrida]KAK0548936.1 rRNA-processing protein fcf1 [Tilletia horrida]KAK0561839.1 rRNA-processing protein fcf1 [Tilletia horrida]